MPVGSAASLLKTSPDHLELGDNPTIQVGEPLPQNPLKESAPEPLISMVGLKGRSLIIGVPGAFTPPCSSQVPGYIEKFEDFKKKGIDNIFVIAHNDFFVMQAWKKQLGESSPVRFLADDTGLFTKNLGLTFDATDLLGDTRAQRFVLIVQDGVVERVEVEQDSTQVSNTSADNFLNLL